MRNPEGNGRYTVLLTHVPVFLLFVLLVSCVGRNFERPLPHSFKPGVTTEQDILQTYGNPRKRSTWHYNGATLSRFDYVYLAPGEPHMPQVNPGRALAFDFHDNVLVGYAYESNYKNDNTDFDESKVADIQKGKTKCNVVPDILGPPSGEYIYPLMNSKDVTGLLYSYSHVVGAFGPLKIFKKRLIVACDNDGTVVGTDYTTSGEP